jgi:hypothetical protein
MPVPLLRHGATLLDTRTERNISRDSHDPSWYMRSVDAFEREITASVAGLSVPDTTSMSTLVDALVAPYETAAERIDSTLIATVRAQAAGIRATLEALEGKLRAAAKRTNATTVDRLRATHRMISPGGTLQERVYPLAFWEARFGVDTLLQLVDRMCAEPLGSHSVIGISDLPTSSPQ